ncbi:MAG: GGDEF domain-containing protein [Candidatus Omnitrophota bacterium]
MSNVSFLTRQDIDVEVRILINQGGGSEILNFVFSEFFAHRVPKYETLAIRFKDKIPTLKRLLQYNLLSDKIATNPAGIFLTFIGFLCSDGFDIHKGALERIFHKISRGYEETEGEGQITSEELSKYVYGEIIGPKMQSDVGLLVRLLITAPVNILDIPKDVDGVLSINANINILEYKSYIGFISGCVEAFNKQLRAVIFPGLAPIVADSEKASEARRNEELDDKLPILKGSFIKNNLQNMINANVKKHLPIAFIMIDVDYFKKFNDTYGHLVGDDVLQITASKIQKAVGEKGKVIRYGGEEISVILPNYTVIEGTCLAERIRSEIANDSFKVKKDDKEEVVQITVSLGVTASTENIEYKKLIDEADRALLYSKAKGRNQVTVFNKQKEIGELNTS